MVAFFLGVVSSLLAAAIFPIISSVGSQIFVFVFSWVAFPTRANVSGAWESTWYVESDRFPKRVTCSRCVIRQLGSRFYSRFSVGSVDFFAVGKIEDDRYLTGTWRDKTEGGYHGSFQLIIDPNSRDMAGLWIGFSTSGVVKHGVWEWHRIAQKTSG